MVTTHFNRRSFEMAAVKVTDSIYSVGILNPNMRVFDIVMSTDYGTTYNSYVLKGERTF